MGDGEEDVRRNKRDILREYYGTSEDIKKQDIYDINEAYFQHAKFLDKMFKEKSLHELMDKESEIIKQIRSLDSEMQTLVYDNYNKFISATDTIKKMKNDFRKMEDEMNKLDSTLTTVTDFSDKVNTALHEKRSHIAQLSGVHTLLHKLQFLFELPNRLKKCIELKQFALAVRYYLKARDVLQKYKHMPSFQGIHSDCETIVVELMQCLRDQLRNPESTTRQLTECVDLLIKLDEPAGALCEEFLSLARDKVDESLNKLRVQVDLNIEGVELGVNENMDDRKPTDILEFMDCGCNGFLGDISLVIASYNELFMTSHSTGSTRELDKIKEIAKEKISSFIMDHMAEYFKFVRKRLEHETQTGDDTMLVRALDKFYRKVQSVHQLMPESGMDRTASNIVAFSAHNRVAQYTNYLNEQFHGIITNSRQALLSSRTSHADDGNNIANILQETSDTIQESLKSVLSNLKAFINHDIAFSVKPYFRGPFCIDDVRQGLVVNYLKHLVEKCQDFAMESSNDNNVPATLLLILCRLCSDFSSNITGHLISVSESWFPVDDEIKQGCLVTTIDELQTEFKTISQELLNRYVNSQGLSISQMLRKSVETRDWLNTIEPRTVRAVMKRVVEDITTMDVQVGVFFEEGVRKATSSDSSKWTHTYSMSRGHAPGQRSQYNYGNNISMDTNLMSNIQKLFSERIEVFTSVDFSKVSVLTGIIKIALKTLLECVRLRTFSKYGLQQIQVDTHYMQLFLWRFVNDENVVRFLLDEAVNSAVHRCIDPQLMEPSVVEMICEKT